MSEDTAPRRNIFDPAPQRQPKRETQSLTTIKPGAGKDGHDLYISADFIYQNIKRTSR
jgi:hypothetical protein